MPLVFVHGVNVRLGTKYEKEMQQRNQYFVNIFYKLLGRQFSADRVISPYWGDLATNTTSGNPYLPQSKFETGLGRDRTRLNAGLSGRSGAASAVGADATSESGSDASSESGSEVGFGVGVDGPFDAAGESWDGEEPHGRSLVNLARTDSIAKVFDIVIAAASEQSLDASLEQARALSELALSALDLSRRFKSLDEQVAWLEGVVDDAQLLLKIEDELKRDSSADQKRRQLSLEQMKLAGTWLQTRYDKASQLTRDRLQLRTKQLQARMNQLKITAGNSMKQVRETRRKAATHMAAAALTSPVRKLFHDRLFLFLGDSFLYFGQRGTPDAPGAIVRKISDAFELGLSMKTAEDPDLIVVAHSMGGNIVCDVASYFRPDQQIDLLITVATQFPLFADLHMFPGIDSRTRPIKKPPNVKRWINVYDMNDIFAFTAQPMFEDIEDLEFASGRLGMTTHADCFKFVSLYEHLARAVSRE